MSNDNYWQEFARSGKVSDYLRYVIRSGRVDDSGDSCVEDGIGGDED